MCHALGKVVPVWKKRDIVSALEDLPFTGEERFTKYDLITIEIRATGIKKESSLVSGERILYIQQKYTPSFRAPDFSGLPGLSGLPGPLSLWVDSSSPFAQKLKSWICAHVGLTEILERGSRSLGPPCWRRGQSIESPLGPRKEGRD